MKTERIESHKETLCTYQVTTFNTNLFIDNLLLPNSIRIRFVIISIYA